MSQVKVPKYIDIEDRVVGPLTLRQFFSIAIPFALSAIFWVITPSKIIAFLATITLCGFGVALAFVKINERPFIAFFLAMMQHVFINPHKYVWRRSEQKVRFEPEKSAAKEEAAAALRKQQEAAGWTTNKIRELAQRLDQEEQTRPR